MITAALKETPLHAQHLQEGGRMVDFGGWHMPLQYRGILEEHRAVRSAAGLFDVSHMGEIEVTGDQGGAFVDHLVTGKAQALAVDQVMYTLMCYETGGVVDDLLVYRLKDRWLLVVNASNTEKDVAWVQEAVKAFPGAKARDVSKETAQLALQGPQAQAILQRLCEKDLNEITFFRCAEGVRIAGATCLVSRTGYTGEDGFEIYLPADGAPQVWKALRDVAGDELQPCGLGARDSLRFEARLPLYGQEISEKITPLEAGLGMFVKLDKDDFIGKEALARQKEAGPPRRLIGLCMLDRGIARHGYAVYDGESRIGEVTTGMFAPTLAENVALALVPPAAAEVGRELLVDVRGRKLRAEVVKTPFYRRARA